MFVIQILFLGGGLILREVGAKRSPLIETWMSHSSGPLLHRWVEYADTYQRQFENYQVNGKLTMLEIGVQSGGSMVTWNEWFSDADFTYVGVDFNPLCKQLDIHDDDKIHIEIGSQEDPIFLQGLCDKYGPFDIVIDDGGHTTKQMITSLRTLFPCVVTGGYYTIEDTCVVASGNTAETQFEGKTLAQHIAAIYESMHYYWTYYVYGTPEFSQQLYDPIFSNQVKNIHMVDSMITLVKKVDEEHRLQNLMQGTKRIPFHPQPEVGMTLDDDASGEQYFYSFKPFVAKNSESFTNEEKKRLYSDCYAFCVESRVTTVSLSECAEIVMAKAIYSSFLSSPDESPYLYTVNMN